MLPATQCSQIGRGSVIIARKNSVKDKTTLSDVCAKFGMPHGFDGPMHALGMHVDSYNPKHCDPVQYGGTQDMILEPAVFPNHC